MVEEKILKELIKRGMAMNTNSISIELKDDWISLIYPYNAKYNNLVKSVVERENWKFDGTDKQWKVKPIVIEDVLNALAEVGADISSAKEHLKTIDISKYLNSEDIESINKICVESKRHKLELKFTYCTQIVTSIKSLNYKKFIGDKKSWEILKVDAKLLYEQIKGYTDCSELEKHFGYGKEKELITPEIMGKTPYLHQIEGAKFLLTRVSLT